MLNTFLMNFDTECDVMFRSAVGLSSGVIHTEALVWIDLVPSFGNKGHPPLLLCPFLPQGSGPLTPQKTALASGQGQKRDSKKNLKK